MKTYTIAYIRRNSDGISLLLSVVPDGMGRVTTARHAAALYGAAAGDKILCEYNLHLTNEPPQDSSRILLGSGVRDPDGNQFKYAIRNTPGISPRIIRLDRGPKGK